MVQISAVKINTDVLAALYASKEVGLELNSENEIYVYLLKI
jgi:hypothetical protein